MKKLVFSFFIVVLAAFFSSCEKTCTCKKYFNGKVTVTIEDVELDKDNFSKCSDMDSYVELDSEGNGTKCR